MFKHSLLLGSILALTSCAYFLDEQIQDVTIVTPGAEDTVCYMYVDGLRYKVFPPQTVNISKSHKDMTVDCVAPQNRRRKVVIEPTLSEHAPLNVTNGIIPGTAWDLAGNALFTYPEIITIDFTNAPPLPEAPPAQNNPDIKQPEEYDLEEFTSGLPRLNSDRNAVRQELIRRDHSVKAAPAYTESEITTHEGPGKPPDKGDLNGVIDGLTTSSTTSKPIAPRSIAPVAPPVATAPAPAASAPAPQPLLTAPSSTPAPIAINPQPLGPGKPSSSTTTTPAPAGSTSASGKPIPLGPDQPPAIQAPAE